MPTEIEILRRLLCVQGEQLRDTLAEVAALKERVAGLELVAAHRFDLGASTWAQEAGGRFSSLRWLWDKYQRLGVSFDRIFAWSMVRSKTTSSVSTAVQTLEAEMKTMEVMSAS